MEQSVVKIENLVKRYHELIALDHFNLDIKQGEVFGLLGPNGSGKTTTINCMLSLLKYDKGSVQIFGQEMKPDSYELKSQIGVVMQNVAVFDELTVYENIDYFCGLYISEKSKRKELVEQAIQFVDLEDDSSEFHNVYEDASIFLQGSCQLFSLALHKEFGYDAFEIRKGTSCHFFCQATYQGAPVYIDVRGATTSWEEFLSGTCADFHDHDEIIPQDIEETKKLNDPDDLYVKDGFTFAKHLIHEHPEYYDISNLQPAIQIQNCPG